MKNYILLVVIVSVCFMSQSCVKNIETETPPQKVQELNVPQNFNWETSKIVTCTVNSTNATQIGIYLDKECTEELVATFTTTAGSNITSLSIPIATKDLYVKYISASGSEKIQKQALSNAAVTFNISDASAAKAILNTKVITKDVPMTDNGAYIAYPTGWGTVMFEDLFPGIGDYDFNDFVASYMIMIEYPWKNGKYDTQHTKNMRVQLRLRALGGNVAFTPYVRIIGLNKNIVSLPDMPYNNPNYPHSNPKIINNTTDGVQVNLVNSSLTTDAIIEFKNLNVNNPYRVPGVSFYNTTPGSIMKYNQLTEVDIFLELSEEVNVADLLDDKIDIFVASENKTNEIHLRGYYPVFSEYDFDAKGVHKTIPYASKNNLVWGVKVPKGQGFLHAIEKINFCNAYPDFAKWATTGGNSNEDWYVTNVATENLIKWTK